MAWTTTKSQQFGIGNCIVQCWDLLTDSATLELTTGLSHIDHVVFSPTSAATANMHVYANALSATTASQGTVSITGCASGDQLYLTVYGR